MTSQAQRSHLSQFHSLKNSLQNITRWSLVETRVSAGGDRICTAVIMCTWGLCTLHVCFSFDSGIYIQIEKLSRQACLINASF